MSERLRIHTEYGTMTFTIQGAEEYIATYRDSENRVNREIAMDLEELLEAVL